MFRYLMRLLSAALTLAYGLSFVAVCLGGCLGAAPAQQHGCCAGEQQGLTQPDSVRDCCTMVPGVSGKSASAVSAPMMLALVPDEPPAAVISPAKVLAAAPVAASPPLVLRI